MTNTLVNPKVIIDEVSAKLITEPKTNLFAEMKFVEGTPGEYSVRTKSRIEPATRVAPGQLIPAQPYAQTSQTVQLAGIKTRIEYTDEDLVQHGTDLPDDIADQITDSLAAGMDKERLEMVYSLASVYDAQVAVVNKTALIGAKRILGENANSGRTMLFAHSNDAIAMEADPDFKITDGNEINIAGRLYGVDIVSFDKVTEGKPFLVKEGAISTYIRKDGEVNDQFDIKTDVTHVVGKMFFGQLAKTFDKFAVIELVTPVVAP